MSIILCLIITIKITYSMKAKRSELADELLRHEKSSREILNAILSSNNTDIHFTLETDDGIFELTEMK
jgi:hypothetical protein